MNYKNVLSYVAFFFIPFSIPLCAMKITIENNNKSRKMLQVFYTQQEKCSHSKRCNFVGINTLLNAPNKIKCKVPIEEFIINEKEGFINKAKWFATLKLVDPTSREKFLNLKITSNKNPIIIHDFDPTTKKISITKGNKEIGFLTYSHTQNKHL